MENLYDKNELKSYKDFYEKIYKDLDGASMIDWEKFEYLGYDADNLNEFLWYCQDDNITFVMKNFDLEKIKEQKTFDDYKWNIILKVLKRFVEKYPNNKLEFVND